MTAQYAASCVTGGSAYTRKWEHSLAPRCEDVRAACWAHPVAFTPRRTAGEGPTEATAEATASTTAIAAPAALGGARRAAAEALTARGEDVYAAVRTHPVALLPTMSSMSSTPSPPARRPAAEVVSKVLAALRRHPTRSSIVRVGWQSGRAEISELRPASKLRKIVCGSGKGRGLPLIVHAVPRGRREVGIAISLYDEKRGERG